MEPSTSMEQGSSSKSHCEQERTGLPKWSPKHKIFLSHSGEQKEFVRQLCKDLEAETHEPFFDERSSSLMMGERFSPLIFEAARQCLVAVVVLSEAFLTSKWPMLELVEFVKAKRSHNPKLKLFPLFYKLSPDDLKPERIESQWKANWMKIITIASDQVTSVDDTHSHLSLSLCVEALSELRGANGLKFKKFASEVEYREGIVKAISMLVAPDLLDDTSDVIGNERLCKILHGMFNEDNSKDSNLRGTYKLGLYGMGGLGKTTMSRALCMFYYKRFNGRVFHVELRSRPPLELQKLVLTKLLHINKDIVERVHTVYKGRKLLKDRMNRQPIFLIVDNITNDRDSQMEALAYLEAGFHLGSRIMITSRSLDVVEELFPSHLSASYCKAMASLSEEEARLFFFQRATRQRKLETFTIEEQEILKECLSQCHFLLDNEERQYHPLALQALADYYYKHDHWNVLTRKEYNGDLHKLRLSNASSNIFRVLGLQFTTLAFKEKLMFLDLCLYTTFHLRASYSKHGLSWLEDIHEDIHEDTPTIVKLQLQSLKRSGIINIYVNEAREFFITIHDLYKEFAKWYVIDGEGSRWCVYFLMPTSSVQEEKKFEGGSHAKSIDSLPLVLKRTNPLSYEVQRIRLGNLKCATFPSKKIQEWCNVVVLQIYECSNLRVLDLCGLKCLCHLVLVGLPKLESFYIAELKVDSKEDPNGKLESLQRVELRGLTSLNQLPDFSLYTLLKTFSMLKCEEFLLEPPQFEGCSQLEDLNLDWNWEWRLEKLKLDTLTSLTSLQIRNRNLVVAFKCFTMSTFKFKSFLKGFVTLTGLGNCSRLENLKLVALPITSLLGLEKLRKLQELHVSCCHFLQYIPNLFALVELKTLSIVRGQFQQFLGVEKLLQLRHLEFEDCFELTSLPDLDHLPNLKYVGLVSCKSLKVKPRLPLGCWLSS